MKGRFQIRMRQARTGDYAGRGCKEIGGLRGGGLLRPGFDQKGQGRTYAKGGLCLSGRFKHGMGQGFVR